MISTIALQQAGMTLLTFAGNLLTRFLGKQKYDSLASFTKSTRVEPIALVDRQLITQPYISDVMQAAVSTFTGYYLQAVSLIANVDGVRAIKILDALNPTRDVANATATRLLETSQTPGLLSLEAYRYKLPIPGQVVSLEKQAVSSVLDTMEKVNDNEQQRREEQAARASDQGTLAPRYDSKLPTLVNEAVNLSVGKFFEVTLKPESDGKEIKIPVSVRVISTIVEPSVLVHILGTGSNKNTAKERYHAWRAGQLHFWRDIVFMQDLIDQHRKNLAEDKSGIYEEIMKRRRQNTVAGMMSDTPSIGSASNIIVMSKRTADALEREDNGRLKDVAYRQRIFKSTYILLMFVIDEDRELVTIYHRDIALPSELSVKELKVSNKGGGPDVLDIMKMFMQGNAPRY